MALANANAKMRLVAALALASGVAACSMLAGLTEDYRYTGGPGSSNEGGSETGSQDGDAPGDGQASETSMPNDGGTDALVASDARFCDKYGDASNVTYCWDFEDTALGPKWGWDDYQLTAATMNVEDGVGNNGSRGLHSVVANAPAGGSSAYIRKQMTGSQFNDFLKQQLSFSFSVKKKSTLYTTVVGAIGYGASLKYLGAAVYTAMPDDGIDVTDPPGGLSGVSDIAKVGTWHRATITMTRTAPGMYSSTVEITSDGVTKVVDGARPFTGGTAPTEILVGAFFTAPNGTIETVIDDVLLTQMK